MSLQRKTAPNTGGVEADHVFDAATFARQFNRFDPEYGPHFNEIYRYMRAHCPVARTNEVGGSWVVTRYSDIERVDGDDEGFSSLYGVFPSNEDPNASLSASGSTLAERTGPLGAYRPGPNGETPRLDFIPLELDPPLHGPYRNAIEPLFSPNAVAEAAPWLLALTDQLIDAIIEKGEGDFSRDLGTPITGIWTMKFLGLPLEDWSDYAWFVQSGKSGSSSIQPRTRNLSERELRDRVAAEVVRQRTQPVPGGAIAHLLGVTIDGRKLDSWEIEAYLWLIIGNPTATQACMASSFVWLSRNVEQRRRLAETPRLIPHAIEELLRVFSPAHAFSRTVIHDVELAGQSLKRGDRVLLSWVSGNRDETEFENPDEVDFDRTNKRHVAFGLGSHRCMGAGVVRLEFRIMFEQLLSRMPDFLVEEAGLRPLPAPAVVAGYQHVPFVFKPGTKVGGPRIAC